MTLPTTQEEGAIEAIQDLLQEAESTVWSTEDPAVFKWHDRAQSERGPGQGMPPELYISQLTGNPRERISADGVLSLEEPTVEVWVYSLNESETRQLARDVISYLEEFTANQEENLPFVDVYPSNIEDYREQKLRQVTDHFIYEVEISMEALRDTGL